MDSLYSDSSRSRQTEESSSNAEDAGMMNYDSSSTTGRTSMSTNNNTIMNEHHSTNSNHHFASTSHSTNHHHHHHHHMPYELEEEDDEDDEEITPAELIDKLQQAWLNEKFAPELLEHQTAITECIIEQVKHMEANIASAKKGDFRIAIHKLELDRIKYMLSAYLRSRVKKIEQFASAILAEDQLQQRNSSVNGGPRSKLSPEEFAYATEYFSNVKSHLTASVLDHLPINLQDLNEAVSMPAPDLNKFVFFRSLEAVSGILVDDDNTASAMQNDGRSEIIDVDKDDLYVMRYKPIGSYVKAGQIQLF